MHATEGPYHSNLTHPWTSNLTNEYMPTFQF